MSTLAAQTERIRDGVDIAKAKEKQDGDAFLVLSRCS